MFGAESVAGTTTTRYLLPSYTSDAATTIPVQVEIPAGVATFSAVRMDIRHNVPASSPLDIVYTLRVNGVPSTLAVTIAANATSASAAATVSISAGDVIDIEITKAASIGSGPGGVICLVEIA